MRRHDEAGIVYTFVSLPAVAGDAATAIIAAAANPFKDGPAAIVSIDHIPAAAITGDNTNTFNLTVTLDDATEIANLDYPTAVNGVKGTPKAFTISGTTAQCKLAVDKAVYIIREDAGTSPALVNGHLVRIGWQGA